MRWLRNQLKKIEWFRVFVVRTRWLVETLCSRWWNDTEVSVDHSHTIEEWDFETPGATERNNILFEQISKHSDKDNESRVFELGCADGVFTKQLSERFAHVMAVDISSVGLVRAQKRCAGIVNIEYVKFDVQQDAIPLVGDAMYDIIFAMDVLEFVRGRAQLTRVVDKLLSTLTSGGLFVFSACRAIPEIREAWWQGWLPEGGEAHLKYFTQRADLAVQFTELHPKNEIDLPGYPVHVLGVFKKTDPR